MAWFERTSEGFGFHTRTDIDSYLRLIRQRIQEKCNTTNELIQMIRRNKVRGGTGPSLSLLITLHLASFFFSVLRVTTLAMRWGAELCSGAIVGARL